MKSTAKIAFVCCVWRKQRSGRNLLLELALRCSWISIDVTRILTVTKDIWSGVRNSTLMLFLPVTKWQYKLGFLTAVYIPVFLYSCQWLMLIWLFFILGGQTRWAQETDIRSVLEFEIRQFISGLHIARNSIIFMQFSLWHFLLFVRCCFHCILSNDGKRSSRLRLFSMANTLSSVKMLTKMARIGPKWRFLPNLRPCILETFWDRALQTVKISAQTVCCFVCFVEACSLGKFSPKWLLF